MIGVSNCPRGPLCVTTVSIIQFWVINVIAPVNWVLKKCVYSSFSIFGLYHLNNPFESCINNGWNWQSFCLKSEISKDSN